MEITRRKRLRSHPESEFQHQQKMKLIQVPFWNHTFMIYLYNQKQYLKRQKRTQIIVTKQWRVSQCLSTPPSDRTALGAWGPSPFFFFFFFFYSFILLLLFLLWLKICSILERKINELILYWKINLSEVFFLLCVLKMLSIFKKKI